jgi:hypothetical protein
VSLGMHNFRQAERETLRVRAANQPVDDVSLYKGLERPSLFVKNPSSGGVKASKRLSPRKRSEDVGPLWTEAPFSYVRPTRSRLRRLRKVKGRRSNKPSPDSKVGTVWDVIPGQAKVEKIPVKVQHSSPKDLRFFSRSIKEKESVVKFWLRSAFRRLRPHLPHVVAVTPWSTVMCFADVCALDFDFTTYFRHTSIVFDGPSWKRETPRREVVTIKALKRRGGEILSELVNTIHRELVDLLTRPQKKEKYVRRGGDRQKKRRSWIKDMIVKYLPQTVKRTYSKRMLRLTLFRVLSRRAGFHTLWLRNELEAASVRRRGANKSENASPESVLDFSVMRSSRTRLHTYGNYASRAGFKAQSYLIASRRPFGC